jgi:hypothetical protein
MTVLTKVCAIQVVEGKIEGRKRRCPACDHTWKAPGEKQTDVNMALAMTIDAMDGLMDRALLFSADSDLAPAVRLIQDRWGVEVTVVDPPRRHSDELREAATRTLHIPRNWLSRNQLPNPATYLRKGKVRAIHKPPLWETNARAEDQAGSAEPTEDGPRPLR